MKYVPIMFKDILLERIRAGAKTQTRRPVKYRRGIAIKRVQPGDLLYVKEPTKDYPNKMFMPKRLATTWLEVLRIELAIPFQITEEEARAEGMDELGTYRNGFRAVWQSIYKGGPYDWGKDPLIRVIEFKLAPAPTFEHNQGSIRRRKRCGTR